ncbi:NAD(P)-binding domain-containing protein [Paenibacillus thailandensis]|uniref:NAD(P)-binding domain-containing protein n=1 Tax=Paenibacillus thailandensis TaxID=393250 RepID=A0ABW5R358_9BACL
MSVVLPYKIGVVGIGKMGSCITAALPQAEKLVLVDNRPDERMERLARSKGAVLASDIGQLHDMDVIILALDPALSVELVRQLQCGNPAVRVVNIATFIDKQAFEAALQGNMIPYYLKIIGEAGEIRNGNRPLLVVQQEGCDEEEKALMSALFGPFGDLIYSSDPIYEQLNALGAKQIVQSILRLEQALKDKGLPPVVIEKVVGNVMKGTCATYPWAEDDIFIRRIKSDLQAAVAP